MKRPVWFYLVGVAAVAVVAASVVGLLRGKREGVEREAQARAVEISAGPRVSVVRATQAPATRTLELQGEARPFLSVTLYAKVSGYMKSITVDKGDHVREGQLVATIESPELDRQYDGAVADLAYKRADAKRAASLAGPGVVSAREAELGQTQAEVAAANVEALKTQKSYEALRAPFAGVVTARFADPGALVQNAANAQTGALPVVTISQTQKLRVYVYVDQRDAAAVRDGDPAEVRVPDGPVRKGRVTRRADELDLKTRTMLVEVDLDNQDGAIVAGSFVWVKLQVPSPPGVEVPAEALVVRGGKPFVGVIDGEHVKLSPVVVGDDDGGRVRLASGVAAGARVGLHLGDAVDDGARVQPIEATGAAGR